MAKQKPARYSFHLKRLGLFTLLVGALFLVRFDAHTAAGTPRSTGSVLAYATEMSRSGLLGATNSARAASGLGALSLTPELNNSAQMKAEDMAAKNYWAHVSPDGTQPWYFFDQAGYVYVRAGENLAYGFSDSSATVDGWMNSPSHKENVLGDYRDVGFGIVNVPDYQSQGNQTIVVAHYGTRSAPAAAAPTNSAPTPSAPSPSPTPAVLPEATPDVAKPSDTPAATQEPTATAPVTKSTPKNTATTQPAVPVKTSSSSTVSVLSMLRSHTLPAAALLGVVLISFVIVGYALTHRAAFQHAVANGEHFVAAHPGVDTIAVAAVSSLLLLTTYGHIG